MDQTSKPQLDLRRVADEIDVLLTEIYGEYIAAGCPTKLGGLRFLDVESSKTFAFERTGVYEGDDRRPPGNLLRVSAPYEGSPVVVDLIARGTHSEDLVGEVITRRSPDVGKSDRLFVEAAYYLPTTEWLADEEIEKFVREHKIVNTRQAVHRILKARLLPYAREVMRSLIHVIRAESREESVIPR